MISQENNIFRLTTKSTSYWFQVTKYQHIEHIYYGPRLSGDQVEPLLIKRSAQIGSTIAYDQEDLNYSLDTIPLEWSGIGYGDYRSSPCEITMPDGTFACDFTYDTYKIMKGCYKSKKQADSEYPELASSYDEDGNSHTLILYLKDQSSGVKVNLIYTVFYDTDVITRRVQIINSSKDRIKIHKIMSMMMDLPNRNFHLLSLHGGWIKEAHVNKQKITAGTYQLSSTTGSSSNRNNPGFIIFEENTTEEQGLCYGFNLIYSGNHYSTVERTNHDLIRIESGINPYCFEWELSEGERFETPEAILTTSTCGLNGISQNFHRFINHHIVRGDWKNKLRPVKLNNWEAHFFQFNERKLLHLASEAKNLGVELFVLDDGWFGNRNSDQAGLGDYNVNRKKIPSGISGLAKKINDMGLDFGLWFEPEMVNEDSALYHKHPEWAIQIPGRRNTQGRHQYCLDLCNKEVQDYIIQSVGNILDSASITYVKWDYNRHLSDAYSPILQNQGEFFHRYVIGLNRILAEIFYKRPHVLLESCSSGGNRFDLGMLCYSPQVWASDNTDPIERLNIQTGLSYFYPPSTYASHVSASPHQQTLRLTPISTRFNVAAFAVLGYEIDLRYLTRLEKQEIAEQIAFYKEQRQTLQYGTFYRLDSNKSNKVYWQSVSTDQSRAVSGFFQTLTCASEGYDALRVIGLKEGTFAIKTKAQYLYIKRFGELVKHILPVELDPNGVVLRTVNKYKKLDDCVEEYQASHEMLEHGIHLNNQFMGTHYNEQTRLLSDFGSNLYTIVEDTVQ